MNAMSAPKRKRITRLVYLGANGPVHVTLDLNALTLTFRPKYARKSVTLTLSRAYGAAQAEMISQALAGGLSR